MPSSWDVYYVVFLSAVIALGIPAALALISRLVSDPRDRRRARAQASESLASSRSSRDQLGHRINARFFMSVNASLALIALTLALIPCVGIVRNSEGDRLSALRALFAIVTLAGFAGLGLLYSSRKGDLSWVSSFQPGGEAESGAPTPPGHPSKYNDEAPRDDV
jgi:NADH:ubiquinone oxidoreductase subunit 3 (subunit A)